MEAGNPARRCRLLFYLLKVKKFLYFNYVGKKAVKLENIVFKVSVNVSSSVLSEKTGQLACILVENGVLKIYFKKALRFKKSDERIWGQRKFFCIKPSVPLLAWFVPINMSSLCSLCSSYQGRIVSFLFVLVLVL